MKSVEDLYKRALELKNKGMSDKEISTELHLSVNTVTWLLSKDFLKESSVQDVKIGWRSAGVFGNRIYNLSEVIADIIQEESIIGDYEVDSILGVSINGIPFATMVSFIMEREITVYRPHPSREEGFFSSNFAGVKGKNVVVLDDVASTGETLKRAILDVQKAGGKVVLAVVLASKMAGEEISGVRVRSILRTRLVGTQ